MNLQHARAECQRCGARYDEKNAMGLAAQHHQKTGHVIDIVMTYRLGGPKVTPAPRAELDLDNPERPRR